MDPTLRHSARAMIDARQRIAAPGSALAGDITLSALLAFVMIVIWATTGAGYFWPMWVWLGLGIKLGLHVAIRRAWSEPRGRHRQLAVQAAISLVVGMAQVVI